MADKNINPMNQNVYNVSDMDNEANYNQQSIVKEQSPYNQMLQDISTRYKQSPEQLEDIMNRISFHETGHKQRYEPDAVQEVYKDGKLVPGVGKGLFMFEGGSQQGGATALNRVQQYYQNVLKQEPPAWSTFFADEGVDATQLSPEEQKMMFMANIRMNPDANATLIGVTPDTLPEFWNKYHYAGEDPQQIEDFKGSMQAYKTPEEVEMLKNITNPIHQQAFQ